MVYCAALQGAGQSEPPLRVEVDDVTYDKPSYVEPVWIQYMVCLLRLLRLLCAHVMSLVVRQNEGVFKVSYKVPANCMSLEVRTFMNGKQIGQQPAYTVVTVSTTHPVAH